MKTSFFTILILTCLVLSACKDRLAIENDLRIGVTASLVGDWVIEEIEIEFQDTHSQEKAGIKSDTIFNDFGEAEFETWEINNTLLYDSTWTTTFKIVYKGLEYYYSFQDLRVNPYDERVLTSIFPTDDMGSGVWKNSEESEFMRCFGIMDNFEILKISDNEFNFIGGSRGIKKMVLIKK